MSGVDETADHRRVNLRPRLASGALHVGGGLPRLQDAVPQERGQPCGRGRGIQRWGLDDNGEHPGLERSWCQHYGSTYYLRQETGGTWRVSLYNKYLMLGKWKMEVTCKLYLQFVLKNSCKRIVDLWKWHPSVDGIQFGCLWWMAVLNDNIV